MKQVTKGKILKYTAIYPAMNASAWQIKLQQQ